MMIPSFKTWTRVDATTQEGREAIRSARIDWLLFIVTVSLLICSLAAEALASLVHPSIATFVGGTFFGLSFWGAHWLIWKKKVFEFAILTKEGADKDAGQPN